MISVRKINITNMKKMNSLIVMVVTMVVVVLSMSSCMSYGYGTYGYGGSGFSGGLVGGCRYCDGITTVEMVDHHGNVIGYKKLQGDWTGLEPGLPLYTSQSKLEYKLRREKAMHIAQETGGYVGYGYYTPSLTVGYGGVGVGYNYNYRPSTVTASDANGDDMYSTGSRSSKRTTTRSNDNRSTTAATTRTTTTRTTPTTTTRSTTTTNTTTRDAANIW
jgi:hypothetical protein